MTMRHSDHPAIIKRLKRADGHLRKIVEMLERGRPCPQIAQQLQAVEGAIQNAKKALIHDHISHCVNRSLKAAGPAGRIAMREFKLVARYL
jgi:DNA-binding FrmR family transcriptional regulator